MINPCSYRELRQPPQWPRCLVLAMTVVPSICQTCPVNAANCERLNVVGLWIAELIEGEWQIVECYALCAIDQARDVPRYCAVCPDNTGRAARRERVHG